MLGYGLEPGVRTVARIEGKRPCDSRYVSGEDSAEQLHVQCGLLRLLSEEGDRVCRTGLMQSVPGSRGAQGRI